MLPGKIYYQDAIIKTFLSWILQSDCPDYKAAIKFLDSTNEIPPPSIINAIIFNALMKDCDKPVAESLDIFLKKFLHAVKNSSKPFQYNFTTAICDSERFEDIWSVFTYIVESCFIHHNIPMKNMKTKITESIKYPNCHVLIDFYVNVFINFFSSENLFEAEENYSILLEWINAIYKNDNLKIVPCHLLQKLLYHASRPKTLPNNLHLTNLILDKSPDIFSCVENLTCFTFHLNPQVRFNIYQCIIYELIYKKKLKIKDKDRLTLKILVSQYIFFNCQQDNNLSKTKKSQPVVEKNKSKPRKNQQHLKKIFSKTELSEKHDKVDVTIADNYGLTALHHAAYVDSVEIAEMILNRGGAHLVTLQDNFGEKAVGYACTNDMKSFLLKYESEVPGLVKDESSFNFDSLKLPKLKTEAEYSILINGLCFLLRLYLQNSYVMESFKSSLPKLSHNKKKCLHYKSHVEPSVCDEDIAIFEKLPQLLDHFIRSIQNSAKDSKVDIKVPLSEVVRYAKFMHDCFE